ncbi:MAG: hypothetical protein WA936_06115 [Erythrobacter sp.]|uniref:hypothetical protein n=1 Tax=Erythrobacter sp. TaxID=1042 RepID=UPI003C76CF72
MTRIESAIARIDGALARIDAAQHSAPSTHPAPDPTDASSLASAHEKLRGEVDSALVEIDALIADLEG